MDTFSCFFLGGGGGGSFTKVSKYCNFLLVLTGDIPLPKWGNCTSMLAVKAKIYGVLYKQSSSIAFDETSSYWSALKSY